MVAPKPQPDLWLALEHCNIERVTALLTERSIDILGGPYGSTPLGWAAFTGNIILLQLLLEKVRLAGAERLEAGRAHTCLQK